MEIMGISINRWQDVWTIIHQNPDEEFEWFMNKLNIDKELIKRLYIAQMFGNSKKFAELWNEREQTAE